MDLVQSEYGWDDETVLNLTIGRLRQITANIDLRLKGLRKRSAALVEWQTRTLAQFIAGTVPVDKGKKNPLAEAADKIRLRMEADDGTSEEDAPPEVFVEQGSQVAQNPVGSFERLTQGFGG